MNTQRVLLDISKVVTGTQFVRLGQEDSSGTTIVASVYDNGDGFDMTGMSAVFCMKLPGYWYYVRDERCTISGNEVTYVVDEERCCSVSGLTDVAYFEIHQGDSIIASTSRFKVDVMRSARSGSHIGGSYDPYIESELEEILDYTMSAVDDAVERGLKYELPVASPTTLGGVKPDGETILVDGEGAIKVSDGIKFELPVASQTELGGVKPDGTTIIVDVDGTIHGASGLDADDLGLEQDSDTGIVYPTYLGVRSANGIPLSGGGGGGGGPDNAAVVTLRNTSGWTSYAMSAGSTCDVHVSWSSTENDAPTGPGTLSVSVNDITKLQQTVEQGDLTIDVSGFVSTGSNRIKVRVTDVYGNSRVITLTVSVFSLSIGSSFSTSSTFVANRGITYTYTPVGPYSKTVHFVVDGRETTTDTVTASGRQQSHVLPPLAHGGHTLLVYFTAEIEGQTVYSNELYYGLTVVAANNKDPVISSAFRRDVIAQYESVPIPYVAYTPDSLTSSVGLYVNGTLVSSLTVDRTQQTWNYRSDEPGEVTLSIVTGTARVDFDVTVTESQYDIGAETDQLVLYLTSYGRSNGEEHPERWVSEDGSITATLSDFDFASNGWVQETDGTTALRVSGNARVTIPYRLFSRDFRASGKTIEVEFATRDVRDYDATVISCMSGGRGISLTAQQATLSSEQTTMSTQYKEDERVRLSFVVEKRTENHLVYVYINGIMSGVTQYPDDDNFAQTSAVPITIGSNDCTVDVFHIRVYDNDLTRNQVLGNWIADSANVNTMIERFVHNDIYDEYGSVVVGKLPNDLPYMVIECEELPQYKGDKKTCSGYFVDPTDATKSFTFAGCQINVQGTSSAAYARKNYDMQFKGGFEMTSTGEHADTYVLDASIKPNDRFVLKADVASSEGANNVELVKLFCDIDPYKRPEELADPLVRKGIWGRPIALFWHDTSSNETSFVGKANFNLPKRAPVPYGYTGDMESWEFQNNTSNLMLFLSDYFDETMITDATTGDAKEAWRYDYEARFPDDTWVDYAKLQELQSFVYSTYRANATNKALPSAYTDVDGNVHTRDTSEYRLARFRTEFGRYAEVSSFIFYYIFTELFLMVDSRAKNLFIGFSGGEATGTDVIDRKAVAEPYDMDTALGIKR